MVHYLIFLQTLQIFFLQNIWWIFCQTCVSQRRKISNLWCSSYWKTHLQVRILNLDIFTRVPLQTKHSFKFLSSPPGLIQNHMTAIKHKKYQVIYTKQLTIKQIFKWKDFYEVWQLKYTFFLVFFLFFQPPCWYNFSPLWTLRVNSSGTTAPLKKSLIRHRICCQKCSSNVTISTYSGTFFSEIDNNIDSL